jgi:hypothetical protein
VIPEAFVAWLWKERHFQLGLQTTDGRSLRVIYPGWAWGSWGPDFRAALLDLDGRLVRGDVEIHVHARDWDRHGHERDLAYGNVVLHVVYEDEAGAPARRSDGAAIPTISLKRALDEPADELLERWSRSRSAVTGLAFQGEGPRACLDPEQAAIVLDHAGMERFRAKARRFEGDLSCVDPGQALWTGVLEALGYSRNSAPFRRLADLVTLVEAQEAGRSGGSDGLTALLFARARLLTARRPTTCADGYAERLRDQAHQSGLQPYEDARPALGWEWAGVRPVNMPTRRVAAAAALIAEAPCWPRAKQIFGTLLNEPPRRAATTLRRLFSRVGDDYWQAHADFGRPLRRPAAVLGPQRAGDIVVNVVLPWAVALAHTWEREDLVRATEACFRAHPPVGSNAVTRHMARQILGTDGRRLLTTACRQQGLLHVYRTWCDARDCLHCAAGANHRDPEAPNVAPL